MLVMEKAEGGRRVAVWQNLGRGDCWAGAYAGKNPARTIGMTLRSHNGKLWHMVERFSTRESAEAYAMKLLAGAAPVPAGVEVPKPAAEPEPAPKLTPIKAGALRVGRPEICEGAE